MTQPPQDDKADETEQRPTLLQEMGGISGLIYSSVPVLVFVLVNSLFSLTPAIWSALGSALAITVIRILRKQSLQPAISGFFGVAIAAFIAYRTGSAKGFFLFGIWASLIYGSAFLLSMVVRWPLVGVIWGALNGHGQNWRSDRRAMHAYDLATLGWALVFGARFIVQRWLYEEDLTGWLAFARIAMGWPLTALALALTLWSVRRAGHLVRQLEEAREAEKDAVEAKLRAKYGEPATES